MPPLDTSPRFQLALRLTALGVRAGFTFSMALVAADIASQLAPPHQQAVWFRIACARPRARWQPFGPGCLRHPMARASFVERVVYTTDEFPFRDRQLAEPSWAPMIDRQIRWPGLARCRPLR